MSALAFTACSQVGFQSNDAEEVKAKSVFGNDGNVKYQDGGTKEKDLPTPMPAKCTFAQMEAGSCGFQDLVNKTPVTYNLEEPQSPRIVRICTNSRDEDGEVGLKFALAYNLSIELVVAGEVCTANKTAIMNLIRSKKFSKADLLALCPALVPASATAVDTRVYVNGNKFGDGSRNSVRNEDDDLKVYWARGQGSQGKGFVDEADAECEDYHSPLVIHVANDRAAALASISLTSQEDGIRFDLLGAENNYNAVQISWFTNTDYRLLALPNSSGRVHGIDQLFGNNTWGPDNHFAADGYAALAKYDLNKDNMIDRRDAIFPKLRVWADKNYDGKSQAGELESLAAVGIIYIDLNYSSDYEESDQWGNQTKMKSVVGFSDGTLDLIFDLWFALGG